MKKTTKEEINGSTLYFFKKFHVAIAVIVLVVTQIGSLYGAYYTLKEDIAMNTSGIKSNIEKYNYHIKNKDIHMTYSEKIHEFVPRGEYAELKETINKLQDTIDKLNDKLYRLN